MPISHPLTVTFLSAGILLGSVAVALPVGKAKADHIDLPNCADENVRWNVMGMIHEHFSTVWKRDPSSRFLTPWDLDSLYLTDGVMVENNHDAEYIRCKAFLSGTRDMSYATQKNLVDKFVDGHWTDTITMYDIIYTIYQDQADPDGLVIDFVWKKLRLN